MRRKVGPYEWSKQRIRDLYYQIDGWNDNDLITKKHEVWSIKKLITLDYYMGPFVRIMRSNGFQHLHYVDPFCGSGLIELMNHYKFPGSPLIPLLRSEKVRFDYYHLTDNSAPYIKALQNRVRKINSNERAVQISRKEFKEASESLFSGNKPDRWKDNGYLVFLDPYGFAVDWKHMERILSSGPVDVIFTFMTWAVLWNKNIERSHKSLDLYFGDKVWRELDSPEDLVNHYCMKVQQLGYLRKYQTYKITVEQYSGHRYDLILATQSKGGGNVIKDLQQRVQAVNTNLLGDAFSVVTGRQTDLDTFGFQI